MMSMGSGKTIVEFFSAEMELNVWRYRSCRGKRAELHTLTHTVTYRHTHRITESGTGFGPGVFWVDDVQNKISDARQMLVGSLTVGDALLCGAVGDLRCGPRFVFQ